MEGWAVDGWLLLLYGFRVISVDSLSKFQFISSCSQKEEVSRPLWRFPTMRQFLWFSFDSAVIVPLLRGLRQFFAISVEKIPNSQSISSSSPKGRGYSPRPVCIQRTLTIILSLLKLFRFGLRSCSYCNHLLSSLDIKTDVRSKSISFEKIVTIRLVFIKISQKIFSKC